MSFTAAAQIKYKKQNFPLLLIELRRGSEGSANESELTVVA